MVAAEKTQSLDFPVLEEMGIRNANEIASYTLKQDGKDRDVLKIRYKRQKGSILPNTRTYRFGRSLNTVVADGGTSRIEHVFEISPVLVKALAELDGLVAENKKIKTGDKSALGEERVNELLDELAELESLVRDKVSRSDSLAVSARFARLKARVASL
jgi:hypothetical protein